MGYCANICLPPSLKPKLSASVQLWNGKGAHKETETQKDYYILILGPSYFSSNFWLCHLAL